ncbi:MAG TPA: hypothetical protein DCR40_05405 [Prolixibacteraceae bacterium]|nr:hypothetical protein [Prolixibacteraceae bacterium]
MGKTDNYLFIKILLAAFFLLVLNSWLNYHIGKGFLETYFVNGILVFFAFVSFFLKYLKKGEAEKINQLSSRWVTGILSFQVIAGFYILFFMAGCFISSIQISSNRIKTNTSLSLIHTGSSDSTTLKFEISEKNPVAKVTVLTIPFGKSFILAAKGYQQLKFQVYPWIGKRIILENEMKVSPTILARVPAGDLKLRSKAKLIVQHNHQYIDTFDLKGRATIVIGQIPEIPEEYFEKWHTELRGLYNDERTIYSKLNIWREEPLYIPFVLLADDSLKLELTYDYGEKFAFCKGIVDSGRYKELKFKSLNQ